MLHNRLLTVWDAIRTGLWFVPTLMVAAGAGLAISMLQLDAARGGEPAELAWWLNKGDGEDARNLLSTLLTALITMASMTFSITVVALTLAANQYGSRLIRIFRADLRTRPRSGCSPRPSCTRCSSCARSRARRRSTRCRTWRSPLGPGSRSCAC